jgi:tryptophanyl-tRNA synthetase
MAADILAYQTHLVPVGEDQRQHIELTTTLAERFNSRYAEVFTVPRAVTRAATARIKDLRNPSAKMGKSGADGSGVIFLRDEPDVIAAKVRQAVTDDDPALHFDPANRPGVANLAVILGALTGSEPGQALQGLHGAAALKNAVTDALVTTLAPIQKRYEALTEDPIEVRAFLHSGSRVASDRAQATMVAAREAIGLLQIHPRS